MNGGHKTVGDTEFIVEDLCDRSKAVGGAGCVGNDGLTGIGVGVHTAYEHRGVVLRRSRHNHVFSTGCDMRLSFLLGQEQTGRLDNVLGADLVPFQVCGVFLCGYADSLAVYDEKAFLSVEIDGALELAVHRIVFEHVGHVIDRYEVVDAHNFDLCVLARCTEYQTADTSETVDTNFNL